jgi:hypothetical protein
MKMLILLCLLTSCVLYYPPEFISNSPEQMGIWVTQNIKQVNYLGWQSPQTTMQNKQGNEEDICILYMSMLKEQAFIDSELVIGFNPHEGGHEWVEYKGKRFNYLPGYIEYERYTYTEVYNKMVQFQLPITLKSE